MPTPLFNVNDLISFADAARLRGVSRQAMSRLVAKGRFRAVSIGGRGFLSRKEIENYVPLKAGRPLGSSSIRTEISDTYEKAPSFYSKVAEEAPKHYGFREKPTPVKRKTKK